MKKIRSSKELSGEIYTQFKTSRNPDAINKIIATCNTSIKANARSRFYNDLELAAINERPDLVDFICGRDLDTEVALWNFTSLTPVKNDNRTGIYQSILNLLAISKAAG